MNSFLLLCAFSLVEGAFWNKYTVITKYFKLKIAITK